MKTKKILCQYLKNSFSKSIIRLKGWHRLRSSQTTWKYLSSGITRKVRSARRVITNARTNQKSILGTSVQFQNRFPTELESRIDRASFERTMCKVNEYFIEAEKGNCSTFCEGFCACFSAYLIYLFTETHYEKVSKEFPTATNIAEVYLEFSAFSASEKYQHTSQCRTS